MTMTFQDLKNYIETLGPRFTISATITNAYEGDPENQDIKIQYDGNTMIHIRENIWHRLVLSFTSSNMPEKFVPYLSSIIDRCNVYMKDNSCTTSKKKQFVDDCRKYKLTNGNILQTTHGDQYLVITTGGYGIDSAEPKFEMVNVDTGFIYAKGIDAKHLALNFWEHNNYSEENPVAVDRVYSDMDDYIQECAEEY